MRQPLPIETRAPQGAAAPSREPLSLVAADASCVRDVPILVVTARRTGRRALREVLAGERMLPETADGDSAVEELLAAHENGRPFPIVLLDARKPGVNGFDIAEQIRRRPRLSATRIVLLLGSGRRGDADRCRQLGIAAYLTKPLSRRDLVAAIETVLEGAFGAPEVPLVTRHLVGGGVDSLRVLLAEDDRSIRALVSLILEKRGHSVVAVENGRRALEALERESFDVLLTDVGMPELDGRRLLAEVRERESKTARRLPVVAMTGEAREEERRRLLEAGMDGYVAKPFNPEDIFFTLESVLGASGSASREARALSSSSTAFDRDALLTEVGGDGDLLEQLVSMFREDWPRRVAQLRNALRDRRAGDLVDTAHALKGSIGVFRSADAFETARRLEDVSRHGDFSAAEATLRSLEEKLRLLESRLSQLVEEERR